MLKPRQTQKIISNVSPLYWYRTIELVLHVIAIGLLLVFIARYFFELPYAVSGTLLLAMYMLLAKEVSGEEFKIHQISSIEDFATFIKKQRAENPAGENDLYAKFQQGQYMYSMFTGQHSELANNRYKGLSWTSSIDYIKTFLK